MYKLQDNIFKTVWNKCVGNSFILAHLFFLHCEVLKAKNWNNIPD